MSDLRERIARVLADLYEHKCCDECDVNRIESGYREYLDDADVLIRELDLAAALCSEYFKGYNNGHDEGFIEGWEASGELHKPTNLKTIQHQQFAKQMRDPDMIAADQEWRDKHAACLGCGLPLPHAAGEYTCLNCKVTLDELQAWQAVVDGELVRPLCRGCWTATTAGECKRGDR